MQNDQTSRSYNVTIANGAAISEAIDVRECVGGFVIVPGAWTDANIGFQVCDTSSGTFVALKDKTGSPLQIASITTNASFAYAIPTEAFPAMFVKLWSKSTTAATTTDTNQGAARSLTVILK